MALRRHPQVSSFPEPVSALTMLQQERRTSCLTTISEKKKSTKETSENGGKLITQLYLLQQPKWKLSLGITELVGPAGAGKTQLALSLCISCIRAGGKAAYISLGGNAGGSKGLIKTSLRLRSMLMMSQQQQQSWSNNNETKSKSNSKVSIISHKSLTASTTTTTTCPTKISNINNLLSQVWLRWVPNTDELSELVNKKLPHLLQQDPTISLVVLDGIASLFRIQDKNPIESKENSTQDKLWYYSRSTEFFQLASQLKYLSSFHRIPFVLTNEVTNRPIGDKRIHSNSCTTSSPEPALGLSWAQCVNTSYFVTKLEGIGRTASRRDERHSGEKSEQSQDTETESIHGRLHRQVSCIQSPRVACGHKVAFNIDKGGPFPI